VAALYESGRVCHVGNFNELEDEMLSFSTAGFLGNGSPDRTDALVWGVMELFPRLTSSNQQNWQSTAPYRPPPPVQLHRPQSRV
jgi:phage terminase large subunit-like protein